MNEIWKKIPEYEKYSVSNTGKVRSENKELKPGSNGKYLFIFLCKGGTKKSFYIHRLVATAFIENPQNKKQVNHKNGIKTDNRVENLEWNTASENLTHKFRVLKLKNNNGMVGKRDALCKTSIPVIQLSVDGFIVCVHDSRIGAHRSTGIDRRNIQSAIKNQKKAGGYLWM